MENIIAFAVEEIALEGREGCSVERLWQVLETRLPVDGISSLSSSIKRIIWSSLVNRVNDVSFFPSASLCHVDRLQNAPTEAACTPPSDYNSAEVSGILIVASEAVRFAVLGLYDANEGRFAVSDSQLRALEIIGQTRRTGALQMEISARLKVAPRNFFYVVKYLEVRGLISRYRVIIDRPFTPNSSVSLSNILYLTRFSPPIRLSSQQSVKVSMAADGVTTLPVDLTTCVVQNLEVEMRRVCACIAATKERVVIEGELKKVLGFLGTAGHRRWRRIRPKLLAGGYIECFVAVIKAKSVACVKLLKDYPPASKGKNDSDDDDSNSSSDEEELPAGSGNEAAQGMKVELSLAKQVLRLIVEAGPGGILNTEIFRQLRMSTKENAHVMVDVVRRYGVDLKVVNIGRAMYNRLIAPPHLLAAAAAQNLPPSTEPVAQLVASPASPSSVAPSTSAAAAAAIVHGPPSSSHLAAVPSTSPHNQQTYTAVTSSQDHHAGILPAAANVQNTALAPRTQIAGSTVSLSSPVSMPPPGRDPSQRTPSIQTDAVDGAAALDMQQRKLSPSDLSTRDASSSQVEASLPVTEGSGRPYMHRQQSTTETPSAEVPASRTVSVAADKEAGTGLTRADGGAAVEVTETASQDVGTVNLGPPSSQPPLVQVQTEQTAAAAAGRTDNRTMKNRRIHAVVTVVGERRFHALLRELEQRPFLLKVELTSIFRNVTEALNQELPVTWGGRDNRPDIKSINRVVKRVVDEKKAVFVEADMAAARGEIRKVPALVREGVPITQELLDQIVSSYIKCISRSRSESTAAFFSVRAAARGQSVPAAPAFSPLIPSDMLPEFKGDITQRLFENGFVAAKMIRVRLLHYFICRLVGLGGFEPVLASSAAPAAEDSPSAIRFTFNQLWSKMPLGLALQVCGSTCVVPDLLSLVESGGDLESLGMDEGRVMDRGGKGRLSDMLNVLQRLGLISSYICDSEALMQAEGEVTLEEPKPGSGPVAEVHSLYNEEALDAFWERLEYMATSKNLDPAQVKHCVPFNKVPELHVFRSWTALRLMPAEVWLRVARALDAHCATGITSSLLKDIADEQGLPFEQVQQISYQRKRNFRLEQLATSEGLGGRFATSARLLAKRMDAGAAVAIGPPKQKRQKRQLGVPLFPEKGAKGSAGSDGPERAPSTRRKRTSRARKQYVDSSDTSDETSEGDDDTSYADKDRLPKSTRRIPPKTRQASKRSTGRSKDAQGRELSKKSGHSSASSGISSPSSGENTNVSSDEESQQAMDGATKQANAVFTYKRKVWSAPGDRAILRGVIINGILDGLFPGPRWILMRDVPEKANGRYRQLKMLMPRHLLRMTQIVNTLHSAWKLRRGKIAATGDTALDTSTLLQAPEMQPGSAVSDVTAALSAATSGALVLKTVELALLERALELAEEVVSRVSRQGICRPQVPRFLTISDSTPAPEQHLPVASSSSILPFGPNRVPSDIENRLSRRSLNIPALSGSASDKAPVIRAPLSGVLASVMVVSLLYNAEHGESGGVKAAATLSEHFTESEIKVAYSLLRRKGFVTPASTGSTYSLTPLFHASLRPASYPSSLLTGAARLHAALSELLPLERPQTSIHDTESLVAGMMSSSSRVRDAVAAIAPASEGNTEWDLARNVLIVSLDKGVTAELAAIVLIQMAAGKLELRLGEVDIKLGRNAAKRSDGTHTRQRPLESDTTSLLDFSLKVELAPGKPSASAQLPPGAAANQGDGVPSASLQLPSYMGHSRESAPGQLPHYTAISESASAQLPGYKAAVVQEDGLAPRKRGGLIRQQPDTARAAVTMEDGGPSIASGGLVQQQCRDAVLAVIESSGAEGIPEGDLTATVEQMLKSRFGSGARTAGTAADTPVQPASGVLEPAVGVAGLEDVTMLGSSDTGYEGEKVLEGHVERAGEHGLEAAGPSEPHPMASLLSLPPRTRHDGIKEAARGLLSERKIMLINGLYQQHYIAPTGVQKYVLGGPPVGNRGDHGKGNKECSTERARQGASTSRHRPTDAHETGHLIAPWIDHMGQVQRGIFDALVQRVLAVVLSHPGITEASLVGAISTIPPTFARDLLKSLVEAGILEVRSKVPRPPSLPLLLRSSSTTPSMPAHPAGEKPVAALHYFPVLPRCTAGWGQVVVPLTSINVS